MKKRYVEFDGLRGWLALWVALAHVFCWCGAGSIRLSGKLAALWKDFTAADAAVETFIILSGFAIHTLLLREPKPYATYLAGRLFRIYPVYLFSLVLSLALAPTVIQLVPSLPWSDDYYLRWMDEINDAQAAHPTAHSFWHAILMHGAVPKRVLDYAATTLLKPGWSISLEWQFYLVAPLILVLGRRSWGIVLLLLAALAGQLTRAWWENPDNAFLPRWLPLFLVGIACAELAARCERDESLARRIGPALVGLGIGMAAFLSTRPASLLIWLVIFTVSIGAWEGFMPRTGRMVGGLMRVGPAQWLGAISYPLYLLHWPFIGAMLALLQRCKPDLKQSDTFVVMLLSGVPLLLALSWIVHRLVEKPLMRIGRRMTHRPAAEEGAAAAGL